MSALNPLLPRASSNDDRGDPFPLYVFCLITVMLHGAAIG
jgi:hypothetical protein